MEVLKGCTGCRACEAICSYHILKVFQPSKSAIKIHNLEGGFGIELFSNLAPDGRIVCKFCKDKPCVKYCGKLKAQNELRHFIDTEKAEFKEELCKEDE